MVDKTMKILATQNGTEWISHLGIRGNDLDAALALVLALLRAQGQEITLQRVSPTQARLRVHVRAPYDRFTPDLREAVAGIYVTALRHLSGRIRVTWRPSNEAGFDELILEDTGQWLW